MTRNLVVCCDGTNNEIAGDTTNVLRLYRCLMRGPEQIAFYDAGVGTVANVDRMTARGRMLSRRLDSAIGQSVRANVIDAYLFLVRHYQPGDRIFLFGFSRGAYTARAVAGMIRFLGLLRPELMNLAEIAWSVYSGDNADQSIKVRFSGGDRFRETFCLDDPVPIHFVGCWDTVSSFGWFSNLRTLPYTANNDFLRHVRHALAIDERRAMFGANHFRPATPDQHTSFKEVWFAGCHSDVGGGYEEKVAGLSMVSLDWMLREASGQDLQVDPSQRANVFRQPPLDPLGKAHESLKGGWHLAELIPLRRYSGTRGGKHWRPPHLWKRRTVTRYMPEATIPVLHDSLLQRMRSMPDYKPRNLPDKYEVET